MLLLCLQRSQPKSAGFFTHHLANAPKRLEQTNKKQDLNSVVCVSPNRDSHTHHQQNQPSNVPSSCFQILVKGTTATKENKLQALHTSHTADSGSVKACVGSALSPVSRIQNAKRFNTNYSKLGAGV